MKIFNPKTSSKIPIKLPKTEFESDNSFVFKKVFDVQKNSVKEKVLLEARIQELHKEEQILRQKLIQADIDFNKSISEKLSKIEKIEEEHLSVKKALEKEISELEEKRKFLLTPINILEEQAKRKNIEADELMEKCQEREIELQAMAENLEDRLEAVGIKEQDLILEEKRFSRIKEGIETSKNSLFFERERFNKAVADFIAQRQSALDNMHSQIMNNLIKEQSLISKEKMLDDKDKEIREEAIRIKDREEILSRNISRYKKEGI